MLISSDLGCFNVEGKRKLKMRWTVISLNGEKLESVNEFRYLGEMISKNGKVEAENRVMIGMKIGCALRELW